MLLTYRTNDPQVRYAVEFALPIEFDERVAAKGQPVESLHREGPFGGR